MSMKTTVILLVLMYLSIACTPSKKVSDIAGTYLQTTEPSTDNQEVVLSPNGNFTYKLIYDVGGTFSFSGTWVLSKGRVKMRQGMSTAPKLSSKDTLLESRFGNNRGIEIKVLDVLDSSSVSGAQITINDAMNNLLVTNAEGVVFLSRSALKRIRVKVFETVDTTFPVKDSLSTRLMAYVNIKAPPAWLTSIPTTEWVVKKERLVGVGQQKEPNVLVKVKNQP